MLAQGRIVDAIGQGSGFFQHGHTYLGHPVACAAALAVQTIIERDSLVQRVASAGAYFGGLLRQTLGAHPNVGDIRGRGFFWGVELVHDRDSKAPFDPALRLHAQVKKQAMALGLMVYPMGGTVNGCDGDHILLAPPFVASDAELAHIVELLAEAIAASIP